MLIHTGEKQHVCPECDKRFTRADNLKRHMLIHTGENQNVCPECDKRFTQASHLKDHMLIHTGDNNRYVKNVKRGLDKLVILKYTC